MISDDYKVETNARIRRLEQRVGDLDNLIREQRSEIAGLIRLSGRITDNLESLVNAVAGGAGPSSDVK